MIFLLRWGSNTLQEEDHVKITIQVEFCAPMVPTPLILYSQHFYSEGFISEANKCVGGGGGGVGQVHIGWISFHKLFPPLGDYSTYNNYTPTIKVIATSGPKSSESGTAWS